ncbi:MAG TPA: nucleotide sugar dehydrogenase [Streptosporangiaceae bacterium]
MRFLPEHEGRTAAVIGLGHVGSVVAAGLADGGVEVVGIDADAALVAELTGRHCRFHEPGLPKLLVASLDAGRLRVTTDYAAASAVDVVIVAVGTPTGQDGALIDTQLRGACTELARHLRAGQLVIVKSTVPPGTTRGLIAPLLEGGGLACGTDFGLAFCPERLSEGAALRELRSLPIIVGGWCDDSADAAAEFWRSGIGTQIIRHASLESAEMVKLADNWWIDHNIALANELAKLCAALDVDVLEVISAANSLRKGGGNVNILLPSVGVGGSCLTKDPWMVWRAAADRGVDLRTIPVVRDINDGMPAYTVGLIRDELGGAGKPPAAATIAVLGLAFKNNTADLRATPALPVVAALRETGATVRIFDPLADPDAVTRLFGLRPAASVREAVAGADCVAVLARHDELDEIDFGELRELVAPSCAVVDGRAYYPRETIELLRRHGFRYRGIGR